MKSIIVIGLCALILGAQAGELHAEKTLALPNQGELKFDLNWEISLADGAFFEPMAIAPDFYYGVTNEFSFGVVHSANSQGLLGVGRAIGIKGQDAYNGVGADFFYRLFQSGTVQLALQGGFYIDSIDPETNLSAKAGGLLRVLMGRAELLLNPHMRFPLSNSDIRGNVVNIPVWLYLAMNSKTDFTFITGLHDEAMQLGVGVRHSATRNVDLGVNLGWPRLAGNGAQADALAANLFLAFDL